MENKDYLNFIKQEHCLPDGATTELQRLLIQELPHGEYLAALFDLAQDCYQHEPDHPRYDTNRSRFPHPNEVDLKSASALRALETSWLSGAPDLR